MPRSSSLAIVVAVVVVFGGYLATGFVLDDAFHVDHARRPLPAGALEYAIRTRDHGIVLWQHAAPVRFEFFRPLSAASMWLDHRVWGTFAPGFHLTNLVLHALAMLLLERLARRTGLSPRRALLVTLAWGLSLPAAAAGWIAGRTDVLAGVCALLAALALHRARRGGGPAWLALACVAVAGAAAAKESGLAAPLLAWLASGAGPGEPAPPRPLRPRHLALLAAPAVFAIVARVAWLRLPLPSAPYFDAPHDAIEALWLAAKPLGYLASALLSLPVLRLAPYGALHGQPWLVPVLATAVLLLLRPILRAAGRAGARRWLGWFAVAILPVVPVIATSLYLYVPLIGVVLLLGTAAERSGRRRYDRWLMALTAAGVTLHAVVLLVIAPWARAFQSALPEVARLLDERRAARVLVIDAPVWSYALPAELAVRGHRVPGETWFVDFAPTPWPAPGSGVRWVDARTLEVTARGRTFLGSPIERFLAFGGGPLADADTAAVRIAASPARAPTRITIRFRDDPARGAVQVLQFDRGAVRAVPPECLRAAHEAGAPSATEN